MSGADVRQVHIQLSHDGDGMGVLAWQQVAFDALEQVGAEMSAEGSLVEVQRAPAASSSGARGIGVDDLMIGIAANAVSTFLFRAVHDLIARMSRRRAKPRVIVLEAGGRRLQLPADAPVALVADQINAWAQSVADAGDVIIGVLE